MAKDPKLNAKGQTKLKFLNPQDKITRLAQHFEKAVSNHNLPRALKKAERIQKVETKFGVSGPKFDSAKLKSSVTPSLSDKIKTKKNQINSNKIAPAPQPKQTPVNKTKNTTPPATKKAPKPKNGSQGFMY